MSVLDARKAEPGTTIEADVCVVGAGAAGITLAGALAKGRTRVCLVEAGGSTPDEDTQALHELDSIGQPVRENFMARARYLGGTCNLWAGRSMRLSPDDLAPRSWVPDSGWPIAGEELADDYREAGRVLDLPDERSFQRELWQGRLRPDEAQLLSREGLVPAISLWARSTVRFGRKYGRALKRSRDVQVLLHANATELTTTSDGTRVDALRVATLNGRTHTVRAKRYVLACGGIENARLLLASRDRRAAGLGNEHDVVGRYFMDHPRTIFGRVHLRPARMPHLRGLPLPDGKVQVGVGTSHQVQQADELLNHYVTFENAWSDYTAARYESFIQTMKVLLRRGYAGKRSDVGKARLNRIPELIYLFTPKELLPHPIYRLGSLARRSLRRPKPEERVVVYFCEQPPLRESRVTLGPTQDALGVPKVVLDWQLGPRVAADVLRLQERLATEIEASGLGRLERGEGEPVFTDASHHMGTTRMGDDPRTSVVDKNLRVHSVPNLYVASSSAFPSAGHANPTLTIVALSLRLARHLNAESEAS